MSDEAPVVGDSSVAAVEAKQRRVRARQEAGKTGGGKDAEIVAIPDERMRNLPRPAVIHGLELILKDLPSGQETAEFQDLLNQWPDDLLSCALVAAPPGGGVDFEATARQHTAWARGRYRALKSLEKVKVTDADVIAAVPDITPVNVADDLARVWYSLPSYYDLFARTVWMMASETPGMTLYSPPIDEAEEETEAAESAEPSDLLTLLSEKLTKPVQYIDLIRVLLRVNQGFPGDMASRF